MARTRTGRSLLAFGAPWCTPWTILSPDLDALAADTKAVTRINVDEDPGTAEHYRVVSLPTFVILEGGTERRRLTGAVSLEELRDALVAARTSAPKRRRRR